MGIIALTTQKREVCFVADTGNQEIRYIDGVKSITGPKIVGFVDIRGKPRHWRPEGIARVNDQTLVLSDSTNLFLLKLDKSLHCGQLISIVTNLESPKGLCCIPGSCDSVFVADGHVVKEINLVSKDVRIAFDGFQSAFDVKVSADGQVGSTDVNSRKLTVYVQDPEKTMWFRSDFIGSGVASCSDGESTNAELNEPTGLSYDMNSMIICCFGGKSHGCIKMYTNLDFAVNFMSNIRNIYVAIGFLEKKIHNKNRRQKGVPIMPFSSGVGKLKSSLTYLQALASARKNYLKKNALDGSDGFIYTKTIDGLAETVTSLEHHMASFSQLEIDTTNLNLYAFTNESRKEHNFAKYKLSGQYRNPTTEQYCKTKGNDEEEFIKKSCQCPHSYHTNKFNAYQAPHVSSLSSVSLIKE